MEITSAMIKALRDATGAGIMECKSALAEAEGDAQKAAVIIEQRGAMKMARRSDRETNQGVVTSYIHGGRIGALVELNCETDFVARTEGFGKLATDVAMHIAAMNPRFVDSTAIDDATRAEHAEDLDQFIKEACLLDQAWIRDSGRTIGELISSYAAQTGEVIRVGRFARFGLGE